MNFIEAVKLARDSTTKVRRKCWVDGVALFIAYPTDRHDDRFEYSQESCGAPYVGTCHVAACELGGVRDLEDILADDWELMYP